MHSPEQFQLPMQETPARATRRQRITARQREILAACTATAQWVMAIGPHDARRLIKRGLLAAKRVADHKARALEITPAGRALLMQPPTR